MNFNPFQRGKDKSPDTEVSSSYRDPRQHIVIESDRPDSSHVGNSRLEYEHSLQNIRRAGTDAAPMQRVSSKSTPQIPDDATGGVTNKASQSSEDDLRYQQQQHGNRHTAVQLPTSKPDERAPRTAQDRPERKQSSHEETRYPKTSSEHRYQSSSVSLVHTSADYPPATSVSTRSSMRGEIDVPLPPPTQANSRRLDAEQTYVNSSRPIPYVQNTESHQRHKVDYLRRELHTKISLLKERDQFIRSLEAKITDLQRGYSEKSRELRSCQSQLDNVHRFISTADTHADQDIIQKLHELNEEVYQISMTLADHVAGAFTRKNVVESQTAEETPVGKNVLETIGQVMGSYLARAKDEETATFLQIAFQACLAHLLRWIASSWTNDTALDSLVEGTYQRLREAETQAISGRWRSLTRAYIFPTATSDPKLLVQQMIAGLSDIIVTAGFSASKSDIESNLSVAFGEKISTVVVNAGRFADMISEMVSGHFEVFTVQPGEKFEGEGMRDMNEGPGAPRAMGTEKRVLCVTQVGLRKRTPEKTTQTLTKAQVVLESFLE